ncbi:MAG: hypothetical protein AAF828_12240, partial [Bacteroidota bacterium]
MRTYLPLLLFFCVGLLTAQTQRMRLIPGTDDCCFSLAYTLDPNDNFNTFEVRLPAEDTWTHFSLDLPAGWTSNPLTNANGFLIYRTANLEDLPRQASGFLSACIRLPIDRNVTEIEIGWSRNGGSVQVLERLSLECLACNLPLQDSVICRADGGYDYYFRFTNEGPYPVNDLRFWEDGEGDFIEANNLSLSEPVLVGQTSDWLAVRLTEASEQLSELCFSITTSQLSDGQYLECCTGYQCTTLPVCDRCCTPYEDFIRDVEDGFFVDYLDGSFCDETQMTVTPRSLSECDETLISRRNIAEVQGITVNNVGNAPVVFPSLTLGGAYEICMQVKRVDLSGEACYERAFWNICDTVTVNCEDCFDAALIDPNEDCGLDLTFACACDSMIYQNECAAEHWSGIRRFKADATDCMEPPRPMALNITNDNDPNTFDLQWEDENAASYRFFYLRFRSTLAVEWQYLDTVPGTVFELMSTIA